MLPAGQQPLALPGDTNNLLLDGAEGVVGQHEVLPVQRGSAVEAQQGALLSEDVGAERHDLAAEDVVQQRQPTDVPSHGSSDVAVGGEDLDGDVLLHPVGIGTAQQQGDGHLSLVHQVDAGDQTRPDGAVGPARQVDHRGVAPAGAVGVRSTAHRQQVRKPELPVPEVRQPHEAVLTVGEPGVQAGLDVDVVVRPGLLDDCHVAGLLAEMSELQAREFGTSSARAALTTPRTARRRRRATSLGRGVRLSTGPPSASTTSTSTA